MRASGSKRGTVIYIDQWSAVLEEAPTDGDIVFVTHYGFDHYDPEAFEAVAGPDGAIAVYVAVDTSDLDRKVVDPPASAMSTSVKSTSTPLRRTMISTVITSTRVASRSTLRAR